MPFWTATVLVSAITRKGTWFRSSVNLPLFNPVDMINPDRLYKLANMARVFQLITVATSAFAITGYYIGNQPLFLSCSIVSAVLSISLIIVLAASTAKLSWVASFAIGLFAVLILIIGMLIDRSFMPGFLLGSCILGLTLLGVGKIVAYLFKSRLRFIHDKYSDADDEEEESEEVFLDPDTYPVNLIERVKRMEEASHRVEEMLSRLNQGLDDYSQVQHEIEMLEKYLDSKQWMADFMADEAGQKCTSAIERMMKGKEVMGMSDLYGQYNDLNEMLQASRGYTAQISLSPTM